MITWLLCKLHLCEWSVTVWVATRIEHDLVFKHHCPECGRVWFTTIPDRYKK